MSMHAHLDEHKSVVIRITESSHWQAYVHCFQQLLETLSLFWTALSCCLSSDAGNAWLHIQRGFVFSCVRSWAVWLMVVVMYRTIGTFCKLQNKSCNSGEEGCKLLSLMQRCKMETSPCNLQKKPLLFWTVSLLCSRQTAGPCMTCMSLVMFLDKPDIGWLCSVSHWHICAD